MINNPTGLIGTADQVLTNGLSGQRTAGQITLTLPQSVGTGSSPTFAGLTISGLTANAFLYSDGSKVLTSTSAATNGQLLIGSTGATPVKATLTNGTGITVTNGVGSITIANAGVTSNVAGTGISVSAATGNVSITNTGVLSLTTNNGLSTNTSATGNVSITNTGVLSLTAGTGIGVSSSTGTITVSNTGVTSVGLSLPSIFSVTNSPVTTTGTLTGTLATQAINTVLAGPTVGPPATPTFRTLGLATNDLNDVTVTSATSGQVLSYNGTQWVNVDTDNSSATANVGAVPTTGGTSWSLVGGSTYTATFTHNLSTQNLSVTCYDVADNSVIVPDYLTTPSTNTIVIRVVGNTKTIRIVAVANGLSMAAGPASIVTELNGTTVSVGSNTLNFTGAIINATSATNVTNVFFGSRSTYYAASLDSPNTSDYAVNAFAPATPDATYSSLTVRAFSNTTEQGVGTLMSIPSGATNVTFRIRGRSATAPASTSNVQFRIYTRLIPNNSAITSWSAGTNLTLMSIPTNANFQQYVATASLISLGLTAGNLYQLELTRYITGVTNNLAYAFNMAELTLEIN